MSMMETGQWGAVWALVETKARDKDQRDAQAATMRRVEGLLEAGKISRAAAAVWDTTGLASAEEVMAKLEQVQKQGPHTSLRETPPPQ